MVHNLTKTTYSAKIGTEAFAENMEALKHNWLFKKYFEERGYWSKTEYEEKLNAQINEIEKSKKELDERLNRLEELEKKLSIEGN